MKNSPVHLSFPKFLTLAQVPRFEHSCLDYQFFLAVRHVVPNTMDVYLVLHPRRVIHRLPILARQRDIAIRLVVCRSVITKK